MKATVWKLLIALTIVIASLSQITGCRGRSFFRFGSSSFMPLDVDYVQGVPVAPGKPVLIDFWATWNNASALSLANLSSVENRNRNLGLQVVGITDDTSKDLADFLAHAQLAIPIAVDHDGKYFRAANAYNLPWAVLLNKNGQIVWSGHVQDLTNLAIQSAFE